MLACPDKLQSSGFGLMKERVIGNVAIVQGSDAETSTTAGKDSTGKCAWMDIFTKRGSGCRALGNHQNDVMSGAVRKRPLAAPSRERFMKFLVIWRLETSQLVPEMIEAVREQRSYATKLQTEGKLDCRYHIVGGHGGAWIYNVESNEELDMLLAAAPVYNFATYQVLPLAEMSDPSAVLQENAAEGDASGWP
jgi:muconolactone delta-isomerase